MSNVLIGIIGVILFIGLALAGALFLGPRFQESTHNSKAAAVSAGLQQVAQAAQMYRVQEGVSVTSTGSTATTALAPDYLKSAPRNPMTNGSYQMVDANGYNNATPAQFVYTNLGGDDTAKAVCRAIERGAGATNPDASTATVVDWATTTQANKRVGCLKLTNSEYDAYAPI